MRVNMTADEGMWRTLLGFGLLVFSWDLVPFVHATRLGWLPWAGFLLVLGLLWTGISRKCPVASLWRSGPDGSGPSHHG